MGNGARLSLLGLYTYDDTLFDGMAFPEDFDSTTKQLLIDNLVMECAEMEVIYSSWPFMKSAIDAWSAKEVVTWNRIYEAMLTEYNPIENYNRTEKINVQNRGAMTHSGNDSDVGTGYDSDVGSGTDTLTNSVSSFDSSAYAPHDQSQNQKGSTITHNLNSTITHNYGHTITDTTGSQTTSNVFGNIGVTTSQQMLEQELELVPKLNVMNVIIESFKNRFCLLVY